MRLVVVTSRPVAETVTGEAHNQRALIAGLARRGFDCHAVSAADDAASAIDRLAPEIVMIWGSYPLVAELAPVARRRGSAIVQQIRTPSLYHWERLGWSGTTAVEPDERPRTRRDVDLVLVPSAFMADYWTPRLGVRPEVMYPVVDPARVCTPRRGARYVTFINPEPGKGLAMFVRIAAEAHVRLPHVRFLVVEGRWTAERLAQVGFDTLPNVRVVPHEPDVRRIWARTQVLLVPSVLPEAFGMVVHEAQLNGIPVIASRIAGIPEAANGGGVLVAPPARCVADWTRVPTAREPPSPGLRCPPLKDARTYSAPVAYSTIV